MTDEYDEDVARRFEELREGVRPTGPATRRVINGLRRRRRVRRALAVSAATVAVVAVVGGITWAGRPDEGPIPVTSSPTTTPSTDPTDATPFTCAVDSIIDRVPPPIADADEQAALIAEVDGRGFQNFTVLRLEATHVGVVALVDGDVESARTVLGGEGIWHVYPVPSTLTESGLVRIVQQEVVRAALNRLQRDLGDRPGFAGLLQWPDAGSVQIFWKGAAPADVEAWVGTRVGHVLVEPVTSVPWTGEDLRRAQGRLADAVTDGGFPGLPFVWTSVFRCDDYTGLVLGVTTDNARKREEIAERAAQTAGVPVMVVEEEAAVPTGG